MAVRPKSDKDLLLREHAAPFNGSTTSYEDIPETESRLNMLSSSNRHSVMHALQNLQEKIHRLELDRSVAAGDMECLANETARFRRMLNVPGQDGEPAKEEKKSSVPHPHGKQAPNRFGFRPRAAISDFGDAVPSINSTSVTHPDVVQPSLDFYNCGNEARLEPDVASDSSSDPEAERAPNTKAFLHDAHRQASSPPPPPLANHEGASDAHKPILDSSSLPSSCNLPPQTPQAVAIALTSAETRCSILEQQLAYMRTLLETAEHDRNEAQRRCRHRGAEFQAWRRSVESQLGRLEAELSAERGRNRLMCEKASSPLRRAGEKEEKEESAEEPPAPVERVARSPKPQFVWHEIPASRSRAPRPSPARSRRSTRGSGIPFVAGKATTPSHNVGLSLQAMMQMANRKSAAAAVTGSHCAATATAGGAGASRRRQHADFVDRQLGQDVRVVLEELIEEYETLCRVHGRCVRELAAATDARVKEKLQHDLTDLVNCMDVKGQQIGRLRAYLASIDAIAVYPAPTEAVASGEADSERRARSIRFLNKARHLQSLGVHSEDIDWR